MKLLPFRFRRAPAIRPSSRDVLAGGFDGAFYVAEYPDLGLLPGECLDHFMELGWHEGRNPNRWFDTVGYMLSSQDVLSSGGNPFLAYCCSGAPVKDVPPLATSPRTAAEALFGREIADLVTPLRGVVDADYYRRQLSAETPGGIDLVAHFALRGWRMGLSPNAEQPLAGMSEAFPEAAAHLVNPYLCWLEARAGRYGAPPRTPAPASEPMLSELDIMRSGFDAAFYRERYPDVAASGMDPAEHYYYTGWREGREPSPLFSGAAYLERHPAVREAGINPLVHYLTIGQAEGLEAPPSVEPPAGEPVPSMDLLRDAFDAAFYCRTYPDVAAAGIDPLEHYYLTGWREGRNPSAQFDTARYLRENPALRGTEVNPLWHWLAIGRAAGLQAHAPEEQALPGHEAQIAAMAPGFDEAFYLRMYQDVQEAGIPPIEHYFHTGWREGRDPNRHFDTRYYLETNKDVRDADLNPFWHYMVAGKAEGRAGRRPGGYRRQILDMARPAAERTRDYLPAKGEALSARQLRELLQEALDGRQGLAVALSHDCYLHVIGGTQIFIADEDAAFRTRGFAYLHLAPRLARLTLGPADPAMEVQLSLDGAYRGIIALRDVTACLARVGGLPSVLTLHSLLGFDPLAVRELREALNPERSMYWLHDYSSLCEGFNLMRNDLDFCHAPAVDSMSCRVCIYGETREQHLARLRPLFEAADIEVVAPSAFTRDLWLAATQLPHARLRVHPHWKLDPQPAGKPAAEGAPRIAFVGYPAVNKGWGAFERLVELLHERQEYRFLHFAKRGTRSLMECEFVATEVTPERRLAARDLLEAHQVDVLVMLSPWPETFSYVAHEGIAAGCHVICLNDSGNVAALVRETGQGSVFKSMAEVEAFFQSGEAKGMVEKHRRSRTVHAIQGVGTTATLMPAMPPLPNADAARDEGRVA